MCADYFSYQKFSRSFLLSFLIFVKFDSSIEISWICWTKSIHDVASDELSSWKLRKLKDNFRSFKLNSKKVIINKKMQMDNEPYEIVSRMLANRHFQIDFAHLRKIIIECKTLWFYFLINFYCFILLTSSRFKFQLFDDCYFSKKPAKRRKNIVKIHKKAQMKNSC